MRGTVKSILKPFLEKYYRYKTKKPINYQFEGLSFTVLPGVFAPIFTISTKLLLEEVTLMELKEKSFLELGCGSGTIATLAAHKGAVVTASDINPKAVENALLNAQNNEVEIKVLESDMFSNIPEQVFDYIIINPPYYPANPTKDEEQAWFCGVEFQYFVALSKQLKPYFDSGSKVLMILSEDCDTERVKSILLGEGLKMTLSKEFTKYKEKNYLFQIHQ